MLTDEQLEDLAALLIARPIDSVEQLDVAELLHAVELAAAAAEHDACEKHLRRAATDAATARLIAAELLAAARASLRLHGQSRSDGRCRDCKCCWGSARMTD